MDTNLMIQSLRDPLGLPFYPIVFQGLGILTFALHIYFVNLVLGGALLAAWGHFQRAPRWQKLSRMLARATTVNLSIAIVLGVAPLLFVQVIYDPFWYTSNLLSAWWTIIFLVALIIGALALYAFYLKRRDDRSCSGSYGLMAVTCIGLAGVIMHGLSMQTLHPGQWLAWSFDGTRMKTGGWGFNAFEVGRLLHFLISSFLNTGVFLMLYGWFFKPREDLDSDFLEWTATRGRMLARYGAVATAVVGVWWLLTIPAGFNFMTDHSLIAGVIVAALLMLQLFRTGATPYDGALVVATLSFLTVLVMCLARESLRVASLKLFGYSIETYPLSVDWGSTILFLATFVIGMAVVIALLWIAFKAGRGAYTKGLGGSSDP